MSCICRICDMCKKGSICLLQILMNFKWFWFPKTHGSARIKCGDNMVYVAPLQSTDSSKSIILLDLCDLQSQPELTILTNVDSNFKYIIIRTICAAPITSNARFALTASGFFSVNSKWSRLWHLCDHMFVMVSNSGTALRVL